MAIGQNLVTGVTVLIHVETANSKTEIEPVIIPLQNTMELFVKEMLLIFCNVMFLTAQVIFCLVIFCSAIGFVTILLTARHDDLISWRIDEYSLLPKAFHRVMPQCLWI